MNRFQAPEFRGAAAFLLILIPTWWITFLYESDRREELRLKRRSVFDAASELRHARLTRRVAEFRAVLAAARSMFLASETVTAAEFELFTSGLLGSDEDAILRWADARTGEHFDWFAPGADRGLADQRIDFLQPSRVVGEPPHLVLSEAARSRSEHQVGYLSYASPLASLFLEDRNESLEEQLVVLDGVRSTVHAYRLGDDLEIRKVDRAGRVSGRAAATSSRDFLLQQVGDLGIYYHVENSKRTDGEGTQTLLLLLGLGLVTAFYARSLVTANSRIRQIVELRTDELTQFAYRISHDLRAPLITVAGVCRATIEDLEAGDSSSVEPNLRRIARQTRQLDELTAGILDLARADLKEETPETLELAPLLDRVVQKLRDTYPDSPVTLHGEVTPHDAAVSIPAARIEQILENLGSNGMKYHDPERRTPEVNLGLHLESDTVRIVVADNGLGIPEELQPRLFQMFQRFHARTIHGGSGLGMAIVKKHVDRLDGKIEVDSNRTGTRITIRIPRNIRRPDGRP